MQILIVDDHDLFRQGLTQALLERTQASVVTEAYSIESARNIIDQYYDQLNLVILDQELPDGDGITLLKDLHKRYPLLPVAMLSAHEDITLMQESLAAGALGFIPKSTSALILTSAVELILYGGVYIPPHLYHADQGTKKALTDQRLSPRQDEVLKLICCGYSNKEIACQLHITEATVKAHVTVILKAYKVASRTMLLAAQHAKS